MGGNCSTDLCEQHDSNGNPLHEFDDYKLSLKPLEQQKEQYLSKNTLSSTLEQTLIFFDQKGGKLSVKRGDKNNGSSVYLRNHKLSKQSPGTIKQENLPNFTIPSNFSTLGNNQQNTQEVAGGGSPRLMDASFNSNLNCSRVVSNNVINQSINKDLRLSLSLTQLSIFTPENGPKQAKSPNRAPQRKSIEQLTKSLTKAGKVLSHIERFQSLWRSCQARKRFRQMIERDKALRRQLNFSPEEFWETLSSTQRYDGGKKAQFTRYKYRSTGAQYEGEMKCGFREGFGVMLWRDGSMYEGAWRDGHPNGWGVYSFGEGRKERYEGMWRRGIREGVGRYIWDNGSEYRGQWKCNSINGVGTLKWSDSRTYEGEFIDNMQSGYGLFTYSDGNQYIGQYESDMKHGYGVFIWPDNQKRYSGWWSEGKQHGYGMLMREIGENEFEVKHGFWVAGKRERWLSQQEVQEIKIKSALKVKPSLFTRSNSYNESGEEVDQRQSFEKPPSFDLNILKVQDQSKEILRDLKLKHSASKKLLKQRSQNE